MFIVSFTLFIYFFNRATAQQQYYGVSSLNTFITNVIQFFINGLIAFHFEPFETEEERVEELIKLRDFDFDESLSCVLPSPLVILTGLIL